MVSQSLLHFLTGQEDVYVHQVLPRNEKKQKTLYFMQAF